jgi:hypothetical protein
MDKLVEGFGGDLEKLRTVSPVLRGSSGDELSWQNEPDLGASRLQILIDSLAAG